MHITATSIAGARIGLPRWFARSYALVAIWILALSVMLLRGVDKEEHAELPGARASAEAVAESDQQPQGPATPGMSR